MTRVKTSPPNTRGRVFMARRPGTAVDLWRVRVGSASDVRSREDKLLIHSTGTVVDDPHSIEVGEFPRDVVFVWLTPDEVDAAYAAAAFDAWHTWSERFFDD